MYAYKELKIYEKSYWNKKPEINLWKQNVFVIMRNKYSI